ncbi:MAG: tRNA (guanosine(37)-N1)-methyltransferase TrmD [Chloroflexi bacterium]|nr:tRNA (guanosine(37)-N1)-methyltransferase TrmD [Chloroflexota bacterium]
MRIDVLTLFPEAFKGPLDVSIIKRAREDGLLDLHFHDIREHAADRHRTVDDYPFGGGHGMVMKVDVLDAALQQVQSRAPGEGYVVYLSPQGERLDDALVRELAGHERLVLVCGRYEGVDERFVEHCVDREVSIGDYILTGGELPAMVLIDAVARHIPGALGDEQSPEEESFAAGLLEHPQYTRPPEYRGWKVPDVLLSGHHAAIEKWKREQRLARTALRRPDLLEPEVRYEAPLAALLAVLEAIVDDLLALLDRSDDDCVNWQPPAEGANSIAGLVPHGFAALDLWLSRALADQVDRDASAELRGSASSVDLAGLVEMARPRYRRQFARLTKVPPATVRTMTNLDATASGQLTVAWCVEHALTHLAEHWGQVQLTRDLYGRRGPGAR